MKSKFQRQLEKEAIKNVLMLVAIGCVCFSTAIFAINILNVKLNADRHLAFVDSTARLVHAAAADYLQGEATGEILLREVRQRGGGEAQYSLNRHNVASPVKFELVLTDSSKRVVYSSFGDNELNPHRLAFNSIVSDNALRGGSDIYNTVYYFSGASSEYVFALPLYSEGRLAGFAQLYLASGEWAHLLTDYQYDTIVTTGSGDIIYCSSTGFLPERSNNSFRDSHSSHMITQRGVRYLVSTRTLHEYGMVLYSLIYYPKNYLYVAIGVVIIALLGVVWFGLSRRMSEDMAAKSAHSVSLLADEMRIINRGDNEHVILLDTGDEFEEIAGRINRMVHSINELHHRNTDLVRLNSSIEMRNLQAQINPHFIYNTLDTIRYLIFSEPDKASHLIETFTHILRYSINNTKHDVLLREDMAYIDDYLYIQRTRFADRFVCDINIDEACYGCRVPKLLLQPIVENSIKYGFLHRMEIAVKVTGRMEGDYLMLVVEDNGAGVTAQELAALHDMLEAEEVSTEHNGLQNVARRIVLQYEQDSDLTVDSVHEQYFRVSIRLFAKGGQQ